MTRHLDVFARFPSRLSRAAWSVFALTFIACAGCEMGPERGGVTVTSQATTMVAVSLATDDTTIIVGREPFLSSVALSGAINETVSFRFTMLVATGPISNARFDVEPFKSPTMRVDSDAVRVYRMHTVSTGPLPGWHLRSISPKAREAEPWDVLVPVEAPRGGLPTTLVPGDTYRFWVDVAIPKGAFEGSYSSSLVLTSGESRIGAIDLHLTVWPFILPDQIEVPLVAELDHRVLFRHHVRHRGRPVTFVTDDWRQSPERRKLDRVLQSTLRQLQRHRVTPILSRLTPAVTIDGRGTVSVDWEAYDEVVGPCLNGRAFSNRVPVPLWPIPVQAVLSSPQPYAWLASQERSGLLRQYLSECADHFREKGWLDRAYTTVPGAAVFDSESIGVLRDFVEVVHAADRGLPIVSRLWPQDMAPYGWTNYGWTDFSEGIDIWMPPAQFYDPAQMASERVAGKRTWLSVDRPPYSGSAAVFAPPSFTKILTWQGEELGAQALFLGVINRWPLSEVEVSPSQCVESDPNVLLYPGGAFGLTEPVPSVRLKYLRQSAESAAYRMLLRDHGLEHVASTVSRALAPYAGTDAYRTHFADARPIGFSRDQAHFDLARQIMADELIKKVQIRQGTLATNDFRSTATWRRFVPATSKMRLTVDGVRLRLIGPRTQWEAEAECTMTLVNGTRLPVGGTVAFPGPLDPVWSTYETDAVVGLIRPNRSRRIMLVAQLGALPTAPSGVFSLPVEFTTDKGDAHRADARVALITAVPFDGSVRIDGDLSDWPPGLANVASDFRLITHPAAPQQRDARVRPKWATTAFVRRDSEYLYIAINCEYDGGIEQAGSRRNQVEYDDLIPVGEEMVEVLIDPLNAGTRSPADLYHIVVKPSGSYLCEKGIRFNPPCGLRFPWPVDIVVSAQALKDRWNVEMRIPLESFDVDGAEHTIWGFNVTRFDAVRQEFSTWSGASGNAYDPLSLGNLYLP